MTRDRAIEILRDDAGAASLWELAEAVDMAIEALEEERPHGEWKPYNKTGIRFQCSVCNGRYTNAYHFCPHCGASMRKEGEAE